ncbi:asparagine synthase-related protein [Nonomuraea sp. WAC 01424]|uniref:asparagine synthase-related protein n=1 Tax=Nonomuraea sp. WAC 01424 TaxID=2203200 RepID=UPI00163CA419|nr:asparagine synthase-related protein [Nonomuraea sp. WAC 01424]
MFHAETPDLYVVGSRALLVHLVAQPVDRVDHDLLALQTMVRQGFFLSDETPYKGVSALRPSSRITVRDGVRTITGTPLPEAAPAPATGRAKRAAIGEPANALLANVAPLRDLDEPVNLALTGGRDTRILAALLHAARVPFRVTTNGLDSHPDVIIAREIAARLKVEHTVIAPPQTAEKDAVLVEHPLSRAWKTLRTCEGMTSATRRCCAAFRQVGGGPGPAPPVPPGCPGRGAPGRRAAARPPARRPASVPPCTRCRGGTGPPAGSAAAATVWSAPARARWPPP